MFNTLRYANMLKEVGFSQEQAETSVNILVEIMEEKLASKQDIRDLEMELNAKFVAFQAKLETLEWRLTVKMGGMLAASIALITTLNKFL